MQAELDSVEAELELVELQIAELLEKQAELTSRKNRLLCQLDEACNAVQPSGSSSSSSCSTKASGAGPKLSKQEMQCYDNAGTGHTWLYDCVNGLNFQLTSCSYLFAESFCIQYNNFAKNPTYVKLVMFCFC